MPRVTRSAQSDAIKAIVEPISEYYNLVSTFPYLPASDILTPPSEGWPEHHIANFRKLGKTEFVVDILTHLSYIRTDGREWRIGYEDTEPINYLDVTSATSYPESAVPQLEGVFYGGLDNQFNWNEGIEPHFQNLDPQIVAVTNGSQNGSWLLLDTEAGESYECIL